ncbi:MAG: FliO/MopB family protein [Armatimonadetes bacterium]|nr:FliO/MopB family protein [Armatimonadota bacterium]
MSARLRTRFRHYAPVLAAGLGLAGGLLVRTESGAGWIAPALGALTGGVPQGAAVSAPPAAKAPEPAPATGAAAPAAALPTAPEHAPEAPPAAPPAKATAPEAPPAAQPTTNPTSTALAAAQPATNSTSTPPAPAADPASQPAAAPAPVAKTAAPRPPESLPEKEIPLELDLASMEAAAPKMPTNTPLGLLSLGLKLAVVLGLAYGSLRLLRRFLPGAGSAAPGGEMGVRSSFPLAPGRSVHLLDVEGRRLLIASTPQQITLLAELSARPDAPSAGRGGESFSEQLQRLTAGAPGPAEAAPAGGAQPQAAGAQQPELLSDEELREEVRRKLLLLNRGADGIARMREASGGGNGKPWHTH